MGGLTKSGDLTTLLGERLVNWKAQKRMHKLEVTWTHLKSNFGLYKNTLFKENNNAHYVSLQSQCIS